MTVEEWKRKNPPIQRKPITNADRIRTMSDEELAEFLAQHHFYDKLWCKRWLEQEASEYVGNRI